MQMRHIFGKSTRLIQHSRTIWDDVSVDGGNKGEQAHRRVLVHRVLDCRVRQPLHRYLSEAAENFLITPMRTLQFLGNSSGVYLGRVARDIQSSAQRPRYSPGPSEGNSMLASVGYELQRSHGTSGAQSEGRDPFRVATKSCDIVFDPLDSHPLVSHPNVE